MKWYQHDSKAHSDEKMRDLVFEFGMEGYGIYHTCLEIISEKIDKNKTPKISISDRVLRSILRVSHQKLTKILAYFDQNLLIFSNFHEGLWNLECPNLLKRLDNWTLRSVVTTEQVTLEVENKNKKEKKSKTPTANPSFLDSLKNNPAYKGIDIDRELSKMDAWLLLPKNKNRQKTPRFILNWLNKIERPLVVEMPKRKEEPTGVRTVDSETYSRIMELKNK